MCAISLPCQPKYIVFAPYIVLKAAKSLHAKVLPTAKAAIKNAFFS